jgi:8-amino-7-oxononanoate synthase
LHQQLERELAQFKECEAALVFTSGYVTYIGVITALARPGDLILCDKRNHASLIDACHLAEAHGALVRYYGTLGKLRSLLVASQEVKTLRRLIVTDAVYSMDGDVPDLARLARLANELNATLIIDEAHGTGVLGEHGHGAAEFCGVEHNRAIIHIGTLSKALGTQGGFVAGSQVLIDWLMNAARPFIYTTGISPALCGAALAALRILREEPQRRERMREVHRRLVEGLSAMGFEARLQPTPIIPVIVGEATAAVALSEALLEQGVWCPAIRPPTVPAGTSRLRVTATAAMTDEEIRHVLAAFKHARDKIN